MKNKNTTHIVPSSKGGWNVKKGGSERALKHFDRKVDAITHGRLISKNSKSELIIHNKDGRISQKDSHGKDPYPPKG